VPQISKSPNAAMPMPTVCIGVGHSRKATAAKAMVTACLGSRSRTATPAMVAATAAWPVSIEMACAPVPSWQPGGGWAGGPAGRNTV